MNRKKMYMEICEFKEKDGNVCVCVCVSMQIQP
jgi:hypothetical protein